MLSAEEAGRIFNTWSSHLEGNYVEVISNDEKLARDQSLTEILKSVGIDVNVAQSLGINVETFMATEIPTVDINVDDFNGMGDLFRQQLAEHGFTTVEHLARSAYDLCFRSYRGARKLHAIRWNDTARMIQHSVVNRAVRARMAALGDKYAHLLSEKSP